MWRLIADCEVASSIAACVKLPWRAAHSKAIRAPMGGIVEYRPRSLTVSLMSSASMVSTGHGSEQSCVAAAAPFPPRRPAMSVQGRVVTDFM